MPASLLASARSGLPAVPECGSGAEAAVSAVSGAFLPYEDDGIAIWLDRLLCATFVVRNALTSESA